MQVFASPIFTALSTAFSVVGAISSANSEAAAYKYNAKIAERNAVISRQQAAADVDRQRRIADKAIGGIKASYAASGVTMEGTPLDIVEESAAQAKLDELNIKYNGELQAMGFENSAALDRARASNAKTSGYMAAGSSLLLGANKTYQAYKANGGWMPKFDTQEG